MILFDILRMQCQKKYVRTDFALSQRVILITKFNISSKTNETYKNDIITFKTFDITMRKR